mgnify:CR=1 FL=1
MKPYKNKQELLEAIQDKHQKYIAEFEGIPEEIKNETKQKKAEMTKSNSR